MKNIGNNYSWQGLLIITLLMLLGIFIIYNTDIFNLTSINDLYNYISYHGIEVIISVFFITVGIYCLYSYITNVLIKPKEETLYLNNIDENICEFIDKKGKKFFFHNENYNLNKYYIVLKTKNKIDKVICESESSFEIPKVKESYWLNFYSPIIKSENIFILPIVYVILLPGLLSLIMSKGFYKIYGLIYMVIPLYFIIYDLVYKIKKIKSNNEIIDESSLINSYLLLKKGIKLISIVVINVILIYLFSKTKDNISKIIFTPFLLCGVTLLGHTIANVINNNKLENIFKKAYIIIFLAYWFGMLLFANINFVKNKEFNMMIFTIPFWISGIYIIYKFLIKI